VAVATATPSQADIGAAIAFDGSASYDVDGLIAGYAWTFGDGTTASGASVSHAYAAAGTYTVTLTVTDNLGATGGKTLTVTVIDPNVVNAPTALTASVAGRTVTLRWQDNASNETGYYVERGTYNSRTKLYSWSRVQTLGVNATTCSDTVTKGTWYYRVQAFNAGSGRTSAYSNIVKANVVK
jgi:PKD repeat protein